MAELTPIQSFARDVEKLVPGRFVEIVHSPNGREFSDSAQFENAESVTARIEGVGMFTAKTPEAVLEAIKKSQK